MAFKEFLKERFGLDMAAYNRKPDEVKASISAEYEQSKSEDKKSVAFYRKENHKRRSKVRDDERKAKRTRRSIETEEDYYDGSEDERAPN